MLTVSHSQISVWNSCNYKWYLSYHEGWKPAKEPEYFRLGTIIHSLMQTYYQHLIVSPKDYQGGLIAARESINKVAETVEPQYLAAWGLAWKFFKGYVEDFAMYKDAAWTILDSEKQYTIDAESVEGRPFQVTAIIDLEARTSRGEYWIWDHKSFNKTPWSPKAVDINQQLDLYAYIRSQSGLQVQGVVINSVNTWDYKDRSKTELDKLYKRIPAHRTKKQMQNSFDEIRLAVDDMVEKIERQIFRRNVNSYSCEKCAFYEPCLVDIKGIDVKPFLLTNFVKKERTPVEESIEVDGTTPYS